MPTDTQPIPFAAGEASGLDPLSGAQPPLYNYMPDAAGALRQRPGIQAWTDFDGVTASDSPVIGMYQWRGNLLYVTEDRTIYALTAPGSTSSLGTLGGTGRPVFTYDQERVVVTGGGAPMQWQGVGPASELAPGATSPDGAPLALTHIQYSAQRFIGNVNNNTGTLQWTPPGPGNHTSWPLVGPYWSEAEAAPDPVVAVWANANEVFSFGTETTQVYSPDPAIAFTVSASLQVGCASAQSVIGTEDGSFSWLDDNRRFITSNGRDLQAISSPGMSADIKTLTDVDDCWSANVMIGSWDLLLWVFRSSGRAFWYDKVTKKWGEWNSINSNGESQPWIARSYYYWADRNIHLIGLADGRIAELSLDAANDDDRPILAVAETGFQDRGSLVRKRCHRVQLQFRRSVPSAGDTAASAELRYRDDLGNWKLAKRLSMNSYQPVMDGGWSLGMYRQRQWRLSWTGGSGFLLAGATETFENTET